MNTDVLASRWLRANPRQTSVTNAGEAIILDPIANRYYNLDGVGEVIWSGLQQPTRIDDLVVAVTDAFDVSPDEARKDVRDLVGDLLAAGLVVFADPPAA